MLYPVLCTSCVPHNDVNTLAGGATEVSGTRPRICCGWIKTANLDHNLSTSRKWDSSVRLTETLQPSRRYALCLSFEESRQIDSRDIAVIASHKWATTEGNSSGLQLQWFGSRKNSSLNLELPKPDGYKKLNRFDIACEKCRTKPTRSQNKKLSGNVKVDAHWSHIFIIDSASCLLSIIKWLSP